MLRLRHALLSPFDRATSLYRRLAGGIPDYRALLFQDLVERLEQRQPRRMLEIGPRDGEDTRRLLTLRPEKLVLVDLPVMRERVESWRPSLADAPIELIFANFMYDRRFDDIEPFDVVWCTGVLYHNPEQLRLVRQLYDATAPGGLLVLETATARRPSTMNSNCVEIWYPPDKALSSKNHLSINVTHLPSRAAIRSWMELVGFTDVRESRALRRVSYALGATRAAMIGRKPIDAKPGSYGQDFPIGRAR
jgi:SAM-dependent methyltransferase